jgi:hypothetical protein
MSSNATACGQGRSQPLCMLAAIVTDLCTPGHFVALQIRCFYVQHFNFPDNSGLAGHTCVICAGCSFTKMSFFAVRAASPTTLRRSSFVDNIAGDAVTMPDGGVSPAGVVYVLGRTKAEPSIIGVRLEECTFNNNNRSDFGVDAAGTLYTDQPFNDVGRRNARGGGEIKLWSEAPPQVQALFLTGEEPALLQIQVVCSLH